MSELQFPEIDFAIEPLPNLYEVLADIRAKHRIATIRWFGQPARLVTRYADVLKGVRDDDVVPAGLAYTRLVEEVQGKTIMCMTGDEHRIHRGLVNSAFKRSASRDLKASKIEPLAHELVDAFAMRGEADLVDDFTRYFSFDIIISILGLPRTQIDELHGWVHAIFASGSDLEAAKRASRDFSAFVVPWIEKRRREPCDDLLSDLATAEIEGHRLSDEEILSFVRLLFPAGADTTYLGTGNMLVGVLSKPEVVNALVADPTERPWAVEEALRWETPVPLLQRWVEEEIESNGLTLPAGQLLWAVGAANRDPEQFEAPDEFRPERHVRSALSFGQGRHFCLGTHLARTEMLTALDVLLDRLPNLRLSHADPPPITSALLRGPSSIPVVFDRS
jgi:cytochrome P450